MTRAKFTGIGAVASAVGLALAGPAWAAHAQPLGVFTFPESVTPVAQATDNFNNFTNVILLAIVIVVVGLLAYAVVKFRKSANPTPAKFSHNTLIEVIWTGVPVLILIAIAIPSFRLLYLQDRVPAQYDLTVKVIGYQWNWGNVYDDLGIGEYKSNMLSEGNLKSVLREELRADSPGADTAVIEAQIEAMVNAQYQTTDAQRARVLEAFGHSPDKYRLAVDNPIVAPAGATVRVQVTAFDVIHNFAMPSFAIKTDAIPGHTNETWFTVPEEHIGTYYGQCSEICGIKHAFMPIQIEIVPQTVFDAWAEAAAQFGGGSPEARQVIFDYKGVNASDRQIAAADVTGLTTEGL